MLEFHYFRGPNFKRTKILNMNKKAIISIVIGTILLYVWGALSWMVLPFHGDSLHQIPEEAIEVDKLRTLMPESGVYHLPGMPEDNSAESMKKVEDQLAKGPRITMMVYKMLRLNYLIPKILSLA